MAQDSTIRLKQMNQSELSGFASQVTSGILANSGTIVAATGKLTGAFYPLNSNPKGYAISGDFISQSGLDSAITQQTAYVEQYYYPRSNPSGYITEGVSSADFVNMTGAQDIGGSKTFLNPLRLESHLFGSHDGHGRDRWSISDGGYLTVGQQNFGAYCSVTDGGISMGEFEPAALMNATGLISGKGLNLNGYPYVTGISTYSFPTNRTAFNADNTGDYFAGMSAMDFASIPTGQVIMTAMTHAVNNTTPRQKVKFYVKNADIPPANQFDKIFPIDGNHYLAKLRTTSFIGGRAKHYVLDRATELTFGFRTHQPITTIIVDVNSTVHPKIINVRFPQTNEVTIGHLCHVKLNFNNPPSGVRFSFINVEPLNTYVMAEAVSTGGSYSKHLKFVSFNREGWMFLE